MLSTLAGMFIEVKPELRNALAPMLSTLAGMIIEVKLVAPLNTFALMLVKFELESNITVVKLDAYWNDAYWNAPSPMLVTLAGMVISVKPVL